MTKADAADAADAAEATETYLDRLVVFQPSPAFRSVRGIAGKKILKRSAWAKLRVDKMDAESTNTPYVRKTKDGRAWIVTIYIPLASMIQNAYIGRLHVEARFADLEEAIKFRDTTLAAHGLDKVDRLAGHSLSEFFYFRGLGIEALEVQVSFLTNRFDSL